MRDFELEVYFSRWEFNVRYNMAGSDAESMPLAELLALADPHDREVFSNVGLGYTQTFGAPALRAAIAATYALVTAEDILTFAGAEEAIYVVARMLLGEDDHAVVVTPNYQTHESVPLAICDVTGVALDPAANWEFDLDRFHAALQPNTRLRRVRSFRSPRWRRSSPRVASVVSGSSRMKSIGRWNATKPRGCHRSPTSTNAVSRST